MSTDRTSNVLTTLHRAFNERDAETFRALLAEDVIWHIPGNHPMAGTYEGLEGMWEGFAARMWGSPARIEDHGALHHPDHEHVAVLFDVIHDFGKGEQRFKGLEVARVRDGQVAERWAFDEREEDLDRLITQAARRMRQPG